MTLNCPCSIAIQFMSALTNSLLFFDRLNLANCAMQRAYLHVNDANRFSGEYDTAKLWAKYNCYISNIDGKVVAYVENK